MSNEPSIIAAEVHAHAQQLIKFSAEHRVGFFICIVESDGTVSEASNLSNASRAIVADAMSDIADDRSFSTHGRGGLG